VAEKNKPIHKRSARNYLLQPSLQLQLGIISVIVSTFFCGLAAILTYFSLSTFYSMVIELTDLKEEVVQIQDQIMTMMLPWVAALCLLYLAINVFLSIYYTHRLVGPTVAFQRHARSLIEGNYSSRINLRKHDAFEEVAEVLNELAKQLEEKP
jgi:nitrate/nitrite-specific signal transduction histidine kinase